MIVALSAKYEREQVEGRRRRGSSQELDQKGSVVNLKRRDRGLASDDEEVIE